MADGDKEPADGKLNDVALKLQQIERESGWSRSIAIGRLILDSFFSGDPGAWQARRGRNKSLRQLAAHPLCPLKKSSIAEAVGIYIVTLEDPSICQTSLTPSHVKCVIQLDAHARRELLKQAEEESLSVRALTERVHSVRAQMVPRKRLQSSKSRKVLDRLHDACEIVRYARLNFESVLWADPDFDAQLVEALRILNEEIEAARRAISSAGKPARLSPMDLLRTSISA